ncbi:MAG: hypothetical protein PHF51_01055 [Candidatus ainarchaeum sp.]|nr:hypothetical protein [Candidatus ainarchaeum sp.]
MALGSDWYSVTLAAVSAVFAIAGLAYMVGAGLRIPRVTLWAKEEYYQGFASVALIVLIFIGLAIVDGVAAQVGAMGTTPDAPCTSCIGSGGGGWVDVSLTGLSYACSTDEKPPFSTAFDYVSCFLIAKRDAMWLWESFLTILNFTTGVLTSYQLYLMPYQTGFALAPLAGLFPINEFTNMMTLFAGMGLGSLWGQIIILTFIRTKLILLLPIGLALRAFSFTRAAGAAMLALMLGLYVVYPMLVLFEIPLVQQDQAGLADTPPPILSLDLTVTWSSLMTYVISWMLAPVYLIVIVSILLPVLNFTLTFTFMKEMATVFGGEIDVSALSKLL